MHGAFGPPSPGAHSIGVRVCVTARRSADGRPLGGPADDGSSAP